MHDDDEVTGSRWPIVVVAAAAMVLFWFIGKADAATPDYFKIGIGQTALKNNTGFGWWQQDGVDTVHSNSTPSWEIGAGWKLSNDFDMEIGYRDLGKHSQFGNWLSDTDYASFKAGGCSLPCSGMYVVYSEARTYGGTVALKYGPRLGDFRPTVAVGIFAFHSTSSFYVLGAPGHIYQALHESENHQRPYIAVGLEYKNVFVEYTMHAAVGTENSPVEKAQTIHFGVKF